MSSWLEAEDKEFFGCAPSPSNSETPSRIGRKPYPWDLCGSEANLKRDMPMRTTIGSSVLRSTRRSLLPDLLASLDLEDTTSYQDRRLRQSMYGRKTPESKEPNLNLVQDHFVGTPRPIGIKFGNLPNPVTSLPSQQMYEWSITGPLDQLLQTLTSQWVLKEFVTSSGVPPALVNLAEPGMKPDWTLTLRTLEPSSGVDIRYILTYVRVNNVLSLTNFEAELISLIFYDGLTGIRFVWKSKVPLDHW